MGRWILVWLTHCVCPLDPTPLHLSHIISLSPSLTSPVMSTRCRKFRHHKMRQASVRLVLSFVVWGGTLLFAVAVVSLVWGAITVYSHVMHEEEHKIMQYSLDTFASSCPPVSQEAYKNAVTWVTECQVLPFESTLRGMSETVDQRSIDQAILRLPQTTTFQLFPAVTQVELGECDNGRSGVWSMTNVYCWARALMLNRDYVLLMSLLCNVLLLGIITFVLSPWSSCQRWHAEWDKKEAEDELQIEENFKGLGTEPIPTDPGWTSTRPQVRLTLHSPMSVHPRPLEFQLTDTNEALSHRSSLKTYLGQSSVITQRRNAITKCRD